MRGTLAARKACLGIIGAILLSGASHRINRGTAHLRRQGPQNLRNARLREEPHEPAGPVGRT